jgi:hypothetical protein
MPLLMRSMCDSGTNTFNETVGDDMERTDGGIYDVAEGDDDVKDKVKRFLHCCYDHFDDIDFFLIIVFDFVQKLYGGSNIISTKVSSMMVSCNLEILHLWNKTILIL